VQHTNATQASRAIEILYALLGDFDRPGGKRAGPGAESRRCERALGGWARPWNWRRLGRAERPIGPPATPGTVTAYDLYRAILDGEPYPVRALVSFGANSLLANGDTCRADGRFERARVLRQIELVETPTSRFADILLPAASWMECSALKVGKPLSDRGDGPQSSSGRPWCLRSTRAGPTSPSSSTSRRGSVSARSSGTATWRRAIVTCWRPAG